MDGYPVPLVASSRSSTSTSHVVTAPLLEHIRSTRSGADFEGLPSTIGQQQAQHSQEASKATSSPLVTYLKRAGKRPPDTAAGISHNRASGKVGAGQGGCTKALKIGGCNNSESTIQISGKALALLTTHSFLQNQEVSIVPLASSAYTVEPQCSHTSVSVAHVSSKFRSPASSDTPMPCKPCDSRRDFPPQYHKKRGSGATAIDIAGDPDQLQEAIQKLIKDFYAEGTWRTMAAHWKTVTTILKAAGFTSMTPLTTNMVITVAASLKEAGFRSGAQYLGIMRMAQAESNVTIPPAVELILKKSEDSLARGLGPACKAPEIRLHDLLFDNDLYEELPVIGGPGCYIVALSRLLREIDSPQSMHTQQSSRSDNPGTSI